MELGLEYSEDIAPPPLLQSIAETARVPLSTFYVAVMDVWADGRSVSLSGGAISDGRLTIYLAQIIGQGQTVTVAYDNIFAADAPGLFIDAGGNALHTFGRQATSNQSTQTVNSSTESVVALSATEITVPEGQSATYTVQLAAQPSANVTVLISAPQGETVAAGDKHELHGGLLLDEGLLTFTPENWDTPQTLTLEAPEDENRLNHWVGLVHYTFSGDAAFHHNRTLLRVVMRDND